MTQSKDHISEKKNARTRGPGGHVSLRWHVYM